jgi:hypothetical protein
MARPRRARYALSSVFLLSAIVLAVAGSAGPVSGSSSLNGRMLQISNFGGPGCGSVTGVCSSFTSTGSLAGEGTVFIDTFPTADGISKAHTVIRTHKGDLHCSEAAVFDLVGSDHAFVDLCVITGGTGMYAGASGYLQEVGTFDFATNLGEARYYGRLFLP